MTHDEIGPSKLIRLEIPEDEIQKDMDFFREKAMGLGASMARVIPADWVRIDERVRLKCSIPLCPHYGKSAFCPPHGPSLESLREAFSRYRHALLLAIDVIPPQHFSERAVQRASAAEWSRKCFEIVGRIETLAFGSGYYFAMGFAQASCKIALCRQEKCLVLGGGNCPYPLKARPSMEGVGIDVYGLVARVGWDIYPIYRSVNPLEVPRALSVGIVFIQ